jgi:hypothetical protein
MSLLNVLPVPVVFFYPPLLNPVFVYFFALLSTRSQREETIEAFCSA